MLIGAGIMYLLDPDRGARRRALLRDKGIHASRKLNEELGATVRDLRNRSRGAASELRSRGPADTGGDEVIQERVRSALGRAVSHPSAITAAVNDGRVVLSGPVLAAEVDDLIETVQRVRGVREVENQLEIHRTGEGVSGFEGSPSGRRG
jgi:osmotically-inducible protein OsmY